MTLAKMIENSAAKLGRHFDRRIETVDAVFDDQLWDILKSYGLLEMLDAGQLTCYRSGVPLTRENVGGFVITPDGPKLISDSAMIEPRSPDSSTP